MLDGSRVLVTGGTGFIATHLIRRLVAEGSQVRATIHKRQPFFHHERVEYVRADLTHMDACRRAVNGMDYVFMCAANTSGVGVIASTPLVHVTPNVVMNTQMLEAAYQADIRKLCFLSSNCVYPPTGNRAVEEDEFLDGAPHEVYFAAGWMKRYAEVLCQTYADKIQKKMPVLVVRPTNAYGPFDDFNCRTSHMMAALIRRVVERQAPLEVWGTGRNVKDMIYISDLVDGVIAAFNLDRGYVAVNIASGKGHSVQEIIETIVRVDGYQDADIRFNANRPDAIPVRLVSTRLARELLEFEAAISLEEGVRQTIQWYRENHRSWIKQ